MTTGSPVSEDGRTTSPPAGAITLRYPATCRSCGSELSAGVVALYDRAARSVGCLECATVSPPVDAGAPGASARREYERRKDGREQRIRSAHPKLGGLILALSEEPQSTRAWDSGARGEEFLARRLEDLPADFRVLHDRHIPGTKANIDHMVVGPTGVWVIDAKRYVGKRPALHVEGGILRPRIESLKIGGRDRTKLVDGIRTQVDLVSAAVPELEAPVRGALCFLEADWPLVGGPFSVGEIQILWPRLLVKRIIATEPVTVDVEVVHTRLATTFPAA